MASQRTVLYGIVIEARRLYDEAYPYRINDPKRINRVLRNISSWSK